MSDIQFLAEGAKRQHEESKAWRERLEKIEESSTNEGVKALLSINGGGAVSMLGFMQALVSKEAIFPVFKVYGGNALIAFCIGIFVAALFPAARVLHMRLEIECSPRSGWANSFVNMCWLLSLGLFVVGAVIAGLGISRALN